MPPPDTIRMVTPEGSAVDIPRDQVPYARSRGYDFETGTDFGQRAVTEIAEKRNADRGAMGDVAAFGAGLARGVSAGFSDVVLPDLGVEAETLQSLKEQNPYASGTGEVLGAVGGAVAAGGAGAIGQAARFTPTGAASALGGRIAARGATGSTARSVGYAALGSAAEGSVQSAGMYLSDVALGNKELSAEGFIAEAATGAALGGAVGGGLAAAERGFIAARSMIPKHTATEEAVTRAADDLDGQLQKALATGDESIRTAKDQLELMRLQRAELDVAAQQRVLEKRAAEAAKAKAAADLQAQKLATQQQLDEIKIAKAKEPKTSRPGRGGKTRSPVEGTPDVAPPAAATASDDVVGAPIGNVRPSSDVPADAFGSSRFGNAPKGMEDASLEDLLKQSIEQGKPTTALDEIHEAMAEIDPEAAKLVDAVRAQEAAAANLQKRFKVRAPQEVGGSTTAVIPDAPNLTLGRVKQMYEKANDAEKAALLVQIGPEKSKALLEIVEGKAGFAKWYKNKNHWWDDPSYRPMPTKPGPSADDLGDLAPRVMPGAEGAVRSADDMARLADDEIEALNDMHRAVAELSEYERSVNDLAQALGPSAPPSAMDMAAKYGAAVDDQTRKVTERMAQVADEAPTPVFADGSGPVQAPAPAMPAPAAAAPIPGSPTPLADDLAATMAKQADAAKAADLVSLPGASGLAQPAAKGRKGAAGMLADIGAANEAMQAVGINLPFMPDVDKIPVIGPIVGMYLKFRAGMTVLGKAGFRVPFSGEARVAAGAAKTRDRVAQSIDRLMGVGAKAARASRPVAVTQAWRARDVLSKALYDDGEPKRRKSTQDPTEMLAARTREVLAAQANPAGVKATVRQQLRDVRDPDVIAAVYAVAQRKLDYLAKHAPVAPPQGLLSKSAWKASVAEIERFARRVRAANDPVSVLDDIRTGRITPEGAETLREVYPQLYAEARERLISQAPKLKQSLPHATIVRLSVLFDAALTPSLEPDNLAAIQAAGSPMQPAPANANAPGPQVAMAPPPAGAPDLSNLYMTSADKRAAR